MKLNSREARMDARRHTRDSSICTPPSKNKILLPKLSAAHSDTYVAKWLTTPVTIVANRAALRPVPSEMKSCGGANESKSSHKSFRCCVLTQSIRTMTFLVLLIRIEDLLACCNSSNRRLCNFAERVYMRSFMLHTAKA